MNYALGILLTLSLLWGGHNAIEAADAERDLATLTLSYDQAGTIAKAHAKSVEAKQDAAIKAQTQKALTLASAATSKANASKAVYEAKLVAIAKQPKLDLAHQCAITKIPDDILAGLK